jgi:hypothetical protein
MRDVEAKLVGKCLERRDIAFAPLPASQQTDHLAALQANGGADGRRRDDAAVIEMGVDAVAQTEGCSRFAWWSFVALACPRRALRLGRRAHHFRI